MGRQEENMTENIISSSVQRAERERNIGMRGCFEIYWNIIWGLFAYKSWGVTNKTDEVKWPNGLVSGFSLYIVAFYCIHFGGNNVRLVKHFHGYRYIYRIYDVPYIKWGKREKLQENNWKVAIIWFLINGYYMCAKRKDATDITIKIYITRGNVCFARSYE